MLTEDRRQKTSWWLRTVVVSRVEPGTRIWVVATKQALHDVYAELEAQRTKDDVPVWRTIKFPAVLDWDAQMVLWPEERPFEYLMKEVFPSTGSTAFEMTYQQNPLPEGERVFKPDWIYGLDSDPNPNRGCLDRDRIHAPIKLEDGWVRCITIDPSPQNFSALMVLDVKSSHEEFRAKVLEIVRAKLVVSTFLQHMERLAVAYKPQYVIPERNSANLFILQSADWMNFTGRYEGKFRVLPHETQRNKQDPNDGVESLALDFEFGRIRLPYAHDPETRGQSLLLIHEVQDYPFARTNDVLMALWFAKANLRLLRPPRRVPPKTVRPFPIPARLVGKTWAVRSR